MFLFRWLWIIFPKAKPYILLDTALLINYISRPRMMTWLRENWRLYHIRCEIRSEINGIVNVASYWVSSWDSWLLLSYLSWILRVFLVAKIVLLVMYPRICCGAKWNGSCFTMRKRCSIRRFDRCWISQCFMWFGSHFTVGVTRRLLLSSRVSSLVILY